MPGGAAADELITGLRAANARLRGLLAERDARIAGLEMQVARIADLETLVADLQAQVADLAARVRQNSKNSSRPPSSGGGLGKPEPKSLRTKSGRKPGRPKGQPGATMRLTDHPDHVIRHLPRSCSGCGASLDGAGDGDGAAAGGRDPAGQGRGYRAPASRGGVPVLRNLLLPANADFH